MVPPAQLTLPDGRLHVGTHLPVMAGRYKYLSTLGEGVSAQVCGYGWLGRWACAARLRVFGGRCGIAVGGSPVCPGLAG